MLILPIDNLIHKKRPVDRGSLDLSAQAVIEPYHPKGAESGIKAFEACMKAIS